MGASSLIIRVGAVEIDAEIVSEDTLTSRHTGKELERVTAEFTCVGGGQNDQALIAVDLAKRDGVTSVDEDGQTIKWEVGQTSLSYSDPEGQFTTYYHSWEMTQVEDLKIEKLIIAGNEFDPYHYSERFNGDSLIISARIRFTPVETDRWRALVKELHKKNYFPVIRKGISDEPREMRFGNIVWSEHDDYIKRYIKLIDKPRDETMERSISLFEPEFGNMMRMLAETAAALNQVVVLLLSKGVITEEEAQALAQAEEEKVEEKLREFFRVDDVDGWDS